MLYNNLLHVVQQEDEEASLAIKMRKGMEVLDHLKIKMQKNMVSLAGICQKKLFLLYRKYNRNLN